MESVPDPRPRRIRVRSVCSYWSRARTCCGEMGSRSTRLRPFTDSRTSSGRTPARSAGDPFATSVTTTRSERISRVMPAARTTGAEGWGALVEGGGGAANTGDRAAARSAGHGNRCLRFTINDVNMRRRREGAMPALVRVRRAMRSSRRVLALLVLAGAGMSSSACSGKDGRLTWRHLRERYFTGYIDSAPVTATYLGPDASTPHPADLNATLPNITKDSHAAAMPLYRSLVATMPKIDPATPGPDGAIDRKVVRDQV